MADQTKLHCTSGTLIKHDADGVGAVLEIKHKLDLRNLCQAKIFGYVRNYEEFVAAN